MIEKWKFKNMSSFNRCMNITSVYMLLLMTIGINIICVIDCSYYDNNYISSILNIELYFIIPYILLGTLAYFVYKNKKQYYLSLSQKEYDSIIKKDGKYMKVAYALWCCYIIVLSTFVIALENKTFKSILAVIGVLIASLIYLYAKAEARKRR